MKAIAIKQFGGPEGLAVIDVPEPEPAAGQVLLHPEAIGVSGADVLIRKGALAAYGFREGHIPGGEVAGTVLAAGAGVDPAWIGQRVWAFATGGGYVERAIAPAQTLVPLPASLSAIDAATLGSSGVVAHFGLRQARFSPGESVLIRGAAGGIGVLAVQLAARAGAGTTSTVAVTTSSAERGDRLRKLGATHVLGRGGEGAGPEGYDVIFDIVAGPDLPSFFARLNPNGRMVAVGAVAGDPPADFGLKLFAAFQKSMSFGTFSAATVSWDDRRAFAAELFASDTQPIVHEVLPLDQAALAHQKLEAGEVFGSLVLSS